MNPILNDILKRKKGQYVHAIEVNDVYELETIIADLCYEFEQSGYKWEDIINFFDTIHLYCLDENNEEEVYNFDVNEYVYSFAPARFYYGIEGIDY